MNSDIALVVGLVLAILSMPAFISAFSSDRPMRAGLVLLTSGVLLMGLAMATSPVPYKPGDVPQAALRVIARLIR